MLRGPRRISGIEKVLHNLCKGLDRIGVQYVVNLPFDRLQRDDHVGVLGRGTHCLDGYDRPNAIVAGIGLMTHPSQWPDLCNEFPVSAYLQHSDWAADVYRPFYGDRCRVWPVGIETDLWAPVPGVGKDIDFLIYDKVHWNHEHYEQQLIGPIHACLAKRGLTTATIRYGHYNERQYQSLLARSRAMLFLSEHESQGLACLECLSSDVPVLAWDQGFCLDPERFSWGQPVIPATSVPLFDDRCGLRFQSASDFRDRLTEFLDRLSAGQFQPRQYVLENLTLEKAAGHFLEICRECS
jgi:hypothetical protein